MAIILLCVISGHLQPNKIRLLKPVAVPLKIRGAAPTVGLSTPDSAIGLPMDCSFEGRLGPQFLPDLLRDIELKKLTGVLRLCRNKITKSIVFEAGEPVNALSSVTSEQLVTRLIREGRASE